MGARGRAILLYDSMIIAGVSARPFASYSPASICDIVWSAGETRSHNKRRVERGDKWMPEERMLKERRKDVRGEDERMLNERMLKERLLEETKSEKRM